MPPCARRRPSTGRRRLPGRSHDRQPGIMTLASANAGPLNQTADGARSIPLSSTSAWTSMGLPHLRSETSDPIGFELGNSNLNCRIPFGSSRTVKLPGGEGELEGLYLPTRALAPSIVTQRKFELENPPTFGRLSGRCTAGNRTAGKRPEGWRRERYWNPTFSMLQGSLAACSPLLTTLKRPAQP